ncbi:MAG: hypothetical protein ACRD38_11110 [Nitrososphaerales archaeon]
MSKVFVELLQDFVNAHKDNLESRKTQLSSKDNKDVEKGLGVLSNYLNGHNHTDATTAHGFELLRRLAYCQAQLYKAWIEASDEVADRLAEMKDLEYGSKELTSLCINTFEEKFTMLFKSPEFASNMGKMLNSLIESVRERDEISQAFLDSLSKISENSNFKQNINKLSEIVEMNRDNSKGCTE